MLLLLLLATLGVLDTPIAIGAPTVMQETDPSDDEDVPAEDKPTKTPSPRAPVLQFGDDAGRLAFSAGFESFIAGDWAAAKKSYDTAAKSIKGADRKRLKTFIDANKIGTRFDKVMDDIARGKQRKCYRKLLKWETKYGNGPLAFHLAAAFTQLDRSFFLVLANYERTKRKKGESKEDALKRVLEELDFSETEVCEDPKRVRRGKCSLKWRADPTSDNLLSFNSISLARLKDGDILKTHRYLLLSLHPGDERDVELLLSFDDSVKAGFGWGRGKSDGKFDIRHIRLLPGRWNDIRIDLWDPKVKKNIRWPNVRGFKMHLVAPAEKRTIFIDEVKLERD